MDLLSYTDQVVLTDVSEVSLDILHYDIYCNTGYNIEYFLVVLDEVL